MMDAHKPKVHISFSPFSEFVDLETVKYTFDRHFDSPIKEYLQNLKPMQIFMLIAVFLEIRKIGNTTANKLDVLNRWKQITMIEKGDPYGLVNHQRGVQILMQYSVAGIIGWKGDKIHMIEGLDYLGY